MVASTAGQEINHKDRGHGGPLRVLPGTEATPAVTECPETCKLNSGPQDPHLINLVLLEHVLQHFEVNQKLVFVFRRELDAS